jgi:hypothetical protein
MSDDIERIPSMRRAIRQGVPKRKPRDMAKPMAEAGKTRDAPPIPPRSKATERTIDEPLLDEPLADEPTLALAEAPEPEPAPITQMEPDPEPEPGPDPEPEPETEPESEPGPEPESEPEPEPQPDPAPALDPNAPPLTMREMFARVEPAFAELRRAAYSYPAEHMNDHIGDDGWTRKQMLSHIAAWHDLTTDRFIKMSTTGQPVGLDRHEDAINSAAARVAMGKSVGEVLKDVEASYARLHRQLQRMTDADLRIGDGWTAAVIAGNTYDHYAQHMADLVPPVPAPGSRAQQR